MVALAAASWGTWSLFLRPLGLPSVVTSWFTLVGMAVFALPFALRGPRPTWTRAAVALVVANAAFDTLNLLSYFAAIEHTTVAIAVLTHYLAPILVAIASPWIDRSRARGVAPAAVVALAGLVIVLEPWSAPAGGAAGPIYGLISAVCYAGNVFAVRRLAVAIGPARAMSYHSAIAAVALLPLAWSGLGQVSATDVAWLATAAATIGAASGIVFARGLARIGSASAAVLTFAEPLVAVAIGALVWDEPLHPFAALGGAMVLGAGIHVARKAR